MNNIETERQYWNVWNANKRDRVLSETSARQMRIVRDWLNAANRRDLNILEVGCGAGWLTPHLASFGTVTATDLSDEVLEEAAGRIPVVTFVAGDFFDLEFPEASFDYIISLEVLSHVEDQPAFMAKIASLLRPGGELLLATQNRPVLERMNNVAPAAGQLRAWVDRDELAALLAPEFDVQEIYTVTPRANRGVWRLVNSRVLNAPVRWVVGDALERFKERRGWGWTLMARARKRGPT